MQGIQCSTSAELGREFRGPAAARRRERDADPNDTPAAAGSASPPLAGAVDRGAERHLFRYDPEPGRQARPSPSSGPPVEVQLAAGRRISSPPPPSQGKPAAPRMLSSLRVKDGELVASPKAAMPTSLSERDPELFATHNQNGFISTFLDPVTQDFLAFAQTHGGTVLDVGAGYGLAGLAALRAGAAHVVINDAEPSHLAHLTASARVSLSPQPIDRCQFPDGHFSAVLISRVLHLMDIPTALDALTRVRRWTQPDGRVFIACDSIFSREFAQFAGEYRRRCQGGLQFPGLFARRMDASTIAYAAHVPATFHYFDIPAMVALVRAAGFCPEKLFYFSRPDYPSAKKTNGRDCLGAMVSRMDLP